jgi:hypothetical protein
LVIRGRGRIGGANDNDLGVGRVGES